MTDRIKRNAVRDEHYERTWDIAVRLLFFYILYLHHNTLPVWCVRIMFAVAIIEFMQTFIDRSLCRLELWYHNVKCIACISDFWGHKLCRCPFIRFIFAFSTSMIYIFVFVICVMYMTGDCCVAIS